VGATGGGEGGWIGYAAAPLEDEGDGGQGDREESEEEEDLGYERMGRGGRRR